KRYENSSFYGGERIPMNLEYRKAESITLKGNPGFSEIWLHDRIAEDTALLGLGDLEVIERERRQYAGGRLDMLLYDPENNARYEVEVMLGATDPSHIIRCMEYWDIERKRYPAYDHVAVLVAEEVTSRFLNVMTLLAGSIPLVAIQLNALKIGNQIVLDFVKVLDQRALRVDDTQESVGEDVDRSTWESKFDGRPLAVADQILEKVRELTDIPVELKYKKRHIAISSPGSFFNIVEMNARKKGLRLGAVFSNSNDWKERFEEVGLEAVTLKGGTRIRVILDEDSMQQHAALIEEFLKQAVEGYQS
ncbi:MAG: hypothetical protein KC931_22350, partial [Candidatus Omnitrophica bacterium]|nr:hypothetical protein [Candidatus Omnitrophota bacterium]